MKKQHFSLVMIFISISLLTSCNSSFLDLDFTSLTDDYQINNLAQKHIEPSNWEEQVEYAMQSNAFKQIGGKNSVDLIDFIICDTIKSEKQKAQLIRANNIPESEGRLGWRCSAKMHTIAGDINVSNYHKFAPPIILHNM